KTRKPGVVIQTSETILCTNEVCDNAQIHRHQTAANVDRVTGDRVTRALCQNCGTLYRLTQKLSGGQWGPPKVEVITNEAQKAAFANRLKQAGSISKAQAH